MDLKTIRINFGDNLKCESDVIKECIAKTKEMQEALKILGVDIKNCINLEYIYTYFILKLEDTKKHRQEIDKFLWRVE